jgi:hypothetical protein
MMPAPLSATRPTQPCGMGTTLPLDGTTKSVGDTLPLMAHMHRVTPSECTPQRSPRHSSLSRPWQFIPYSRLRRVSSPSTSSAVPSQPLLRCAPERAVARARCACTPRARSVRRRMTPGCSRESLPEDTGTKSVLEFLSANTTESLTMGEFCLTQGYGIRY